MNPPVPRPAAEAQEGGHLGREGRAGELRAPCDWGARPEVTPTTRKRRGFPGPLPPRSSAPPLPPRPPSSPFVSPPLSLPSPPPRPSPPNLRSWEESQDGGEIRWRWRGGGLRPAAQPGRGGGQRRRGGRGARGRRLRRRRRRQRARREQLAAHLPLLQHFLVLLGLPLRLPALPPGQEAAPQRRRRRRGGPAAAAARGRRPPPPDALGRAAAAAAGGAAVARLPVDRAGAASLLRGRGHRPVACPRLLPQGGLRLLRADPLLRAGAVPVGAEPELPLVRAGLHGRRAGRRGGAQQPGPPHDGGRLRPWRGGPGHAGGAAPLPPLRVDLAVGHPPAADGAGVEVRALRGRGRGPGQLALQRAPWARPEPSGVRSALEGPRRWAPRTGLAGGLEGGLCHALPLASQKDHRAVWIPGHAFWPGEAQVPLYVFIPGSHLAETLPHPAFSLSL